MSHSCCSTDDCPILRSEVSHTKLQHLWGSWVVGLLCWHGLAAVIMLVLTTCLRSFGIWKGTCAMAVTHIWLAVLVMEMPVLSRRGDLSVQFRTTTKEASLTNWTSSPFTKGRLPYQSYCDTGQEKKLSDFTSCMAQIWPFSLKICYRKMQW